jgi:hypothetical protein
LATERHRIRVHFFGRQSDRPAIALAGALGVGALPRPEGIEAARYDRLAERAPLDFENVTGDSADVWLYAHDLATPAEIESQLEKLPDGRPGCFFFYSNDDALPIQVERPNVTVFRTSLFRSLRMPHEQAMPALSDDLLAQNGKALEARPWSPTPSVGFCGFVGSLFKRLGFQLVMQREKSSGLTLRERALSALEHSSSVQTNFVRRTSFWGGSMSRFHFDPEHQKKVRREFVDNLLGTDYTLCVRGKGNFSYRLYEVLSAGRIPVFVNSDCVLPFDGRVDWKRHVVHVEESELSQIGEKVLAFHRRLGAEGFRELQHENRRLWQEWLSPEGFFTRALDRSAASEQKPW